MKLARFGAAGSERPGVLLDDGTRINVSAFVRDYDEAFFGGDGIRALGAWVAEEGENAPRVPDDIRIGPPLARPSKIVCIGLNFRDHAPRATWTCRKSRSCSSRPRPPSSDPTILS